jgi:hypothetical protein
MTTERPRLGIFATVNGVEYRADSYPMNGRVTLFAGEDPNSDLFAWSAAHNGWVATVPAGACDRLVEITSLADYQGHTCQVISIAPDGSVGLYYAGEEKAAVLRDGFVQIEAGTWAKTVDVHDLHRYRERHTDLRFDEWKATKAASTSASA